MISQDDWTRPHILYVHLLQLQPVHAEEPQRRVSEPSGCCAHALKTLCRDSSWHVRPNILSFETFLTICPSSEPLVEEVEPKIPSLLSTAQTCPRTISTQVRLTARSMIISLFWIYCWKQISRTSLFRWTCWVRERVQTESMASTTWSTRISYIDRNEHKTLDMSLVLGKDKRQPILTNWWCRALCDKEQTFSISYVNHVMCLWLHIYCKKKQFCVDIFTVNMIFHIASNFTSIHMYKSVKGKQFKSWFENKWYS